GRIDSVVRRQLRQQRLRAIHRGEAGDTSAAQRRGDPAVSPATGVMGGGRSRELCHSSNFLAAAPRKGNELLAGLLCIYYISRGDGMRDGDYEWFVTLAELQHVTAAAEQLRMAQPTLTRMLARLERRLGVQLFDRHGRRLSLNAYGRIFYQHARRAQLELDSARRAIDH